MQPGPGVSGEQRRGHRAVNTKVYLRTNRERARRLPPPNPLIDPLATIKNPIRAFRTNRREHAILEALLARFTRSGDAIVEFTPIDVQLIRASFLATQRQFARMIGVSTRRCAIGRPAAAGRTARRARCCG